MALEYKLGITGSAEFARAFRPCLINGGMPSGERFFCRARQNLQEYFVYFKNF